jgi:uncharacterized protein (TIGR03086 family)
MSTKPYEQAIASTKAVLAHVEASHLDQPTPCESWKVSDLVNHVVGAQHFFRAGLTGQPPSADRPDAAAGDYRAAFDEASAGALAAFQQEGVMGRMVKMPFGEMPGTAVAGLAAIDTFVHGWDLAKATGQSTDLAPELATALLEGAKRTVPDTFRGPDGKAPFGAAVEPGADATPADRLAAFLGRSID